ncbi:uncharacterized protein [Haliotis asinina]|uniref:uncharacterized protein n=1 Tax=Haliotis asinina TaxID=109174 RepID=UPI00353205D4
MSRSLVSSSGSRLLAPRTPELQPALKVPGAAFDALLMVEPTLMQTLMPLPMPMLMPTPTPQASAPGGGRLGIFWRNWSILEDPYITRILKKGYKLPVRQPPLLTSQSSARVYPELHRQLLADNIEMLLGKCAIEKVLDPHSRGFYSPIFLIPKKDSDKLRMIHNMAAFNNHYLMEPPHFKMVSLEQLRLKLVLGAWLCSLDLPDVYLHVPICPAHKKFLRFVFYSRHYQWRVLPFGISTALWLFTGTRTPISQFLHLRQIKFDPYIDDCLLNQSEPQLLRRLWHPSPGAVRVDNKPGKSQLHPTQELVFIGGLFQTQYDHVRFPLGRWEKISVVNGLSELLLLRQWQSLLGLLTSAQDLTRRGRLMLRPLQRYLLPYIQADDVTTKLLLLVHLHQYLQWWTINSKVCNGVCLTKFVQDHKLFVDASLQG